MEPGEESVLSVGRELLVLFLRHFRFARAFFLASSSVLLLSVSDVCKILKTAETEKVLFGAQ